MADEHAISLMCNSDSDIFQSINQSIDQSYFLMWPKQQTATSRTTDGRNS